MHGNQRQTQLAYVAGILDADGCFMISKHSRKTKENRKWKKFEQLHPIYGPTIKIAMVEEDAIKFITHELNYGSYYLVGTRKDRPNSKPIFNWYLRGAKKVHPFLQEIIPFLHVKKNRAKFLSDFCIKGDFVNVGYKGVSPEKLKYREESYWKMRELNGTKVAATTESLGSEKTSDSLTS